MNHFIVLFVCFTLSNAYSLGKFSLLMPNVKPYMDELYLCTPVRINFSKNYYITGFEPSASAERVHHMLLYGCSYPGKSEDSWNCGEMAAATTEDASNPCSNGSQIIYAWARDAPKLELPQDVGFQVGGDSPIQYLVLQVHYAHAVEGTDNSGVNLIYTERPLPKLAGVFLLGTGGYVPPKSVENMETACMIEEDKILHPFAFRTHTHSLGRVVSGYRVRMDENGNNHWTLLGKKNPLLPQMFYPVINDNLLIMKNDILAARCTMYSGRTTKTFIGSTNKDEMCNFYLMYWVEGTTPLSQKYCFSSGPPKYYWNSGGLNNIPNDEDLTFE